VPTADTTPRALSRRERQVLEHVAEGLTARAIAGQLGTTRNTVENQLRVLRIKLGARDRAHAVAIAYQHGLLAMPAGSEPVIRRPGQPPQQTPPLGGIRRPTPDVAVYPGYASLAFGTESHP